MESFAHVMLYTFVVLADPTNADNITTPGFSTTSTTALTSHVCKDAIDNCRFFGKAPCTEKVYESWAKAHCAKFCGFCKSDNATQSECQNKLPNCNEFDDGTLCTANSYYAWAYEYCKGYCKFDQCNDSCHDQANFDCQSVDNALSICADRQKAMSVCPKYCNVCPLNGRWSQWTAWLECSVTCGNGTKSRTRVCNNPRPANGGLSCDGAHTELENCSMSLCPVHGGWGSWANWSSCSASCDTGLQNRHRMCDSPRPARQGDHCFGSENEYQICSPGKCSAVRMSAFTVTNPQEASVGSDLTFTTVVLNKGSDYNTVTGHFKCSIPGVYFFTLSLTKIRSSDDSINDLVYCYIRKNSLNKVSAQIDPDDGDADNGSYGTTASATLELAFGDVVSVGGCTPSSHMESWSSFTGFLVSPSS